MKTKMMLVAGLILGLSVTYVFGQPSRILKAKIPFPFMVVDKDLPAGEYEISYDVSGDAFRVKGGSQEGALVPTVTRLAGGIHTTPKDAHVVFDRIGDMYMLSEIWYPAEDGFLLQTTRDKHTHAIVTVAYSVSPQPAPLKP